MAVTTFWLGLKFEKCFVVYSDSATTFYFHSILTFDFDLILGLFLTFWGHIRLFLGLGEVKNCFGVYL